MPIAKTKGPVYKVPCPHCGVGQDFRDMEGAGLEKGSTITCGDEVNPGCGRVSKIAKIWKIQMIELVPR